MASLWPAKVEELVPSKDVWTVYANTHEVPGETQNIDRRNILAPIISSEEIPIISKHMDITLLLNENPSIFRQEPSHEVDMAWRLIGDTRPIPLTRDEVLALGKNPADRVRLPKSFGVGESYAGRMDVFHQIHCLDALRREAYFEHYYSETYPNGWNDTTEKHRLHLSHCIEFLLHNIMCQASTDVYTHAWTDTVGKYFSPPL